MEMLMRATATMTDGETDENKRDKDRASLRDVVC